MAMQILRYQKSQFKSLYFMGVLWLVFSLINLFLNPHIDWKAYLYVGLGIIYTMLFFFDTEKNYVLIDKEHIVVNGIFRKKIRRDAVKSIAYEMNLLVISTPDKTVKINMGLIHKDDLTMAMQLHV